MTTRFTEETGVRVYSLMSEEDYVAESVRTLGDNWFSDDQDTRFMTHSVLGMSSELEELTRAMKVYGKILTAKANGESYSESEFHAVRINVIEECGDVLWYNAIPRRAYHCVPMTDDERGYYLESLIEFDSTALEGLAIEIGHMANEVKRALFYGADISVNVITESVQKIDICIEEILETTGIESNLFHARAVNINKLRRRFPLKFESEQAINRNTDEEFKVMDKTSTANGLVQ